MTISHSVIESILAHAREAAPRECCGLLVGKGQAIERSLRARNLDDRPTRYLIDPQDHFAAIRAARSEGGDVIGAYHSHPASAAVPSATDIAEANTSADFVYVIVSLVDEEIRAYFFEQGSFVHQPFALSP